MNFFTSYFLIIFIILNQFFLSSPTS